MKKKNAKDYIGKTLSVPVVFDTKNALENFSEAKHLVKVYVAYAGDNRNYSSISKEVFESMIPSLYQSPIVGEFDEKNGDFKSHGEQVVITDGEVEYRKNTHAYGYIDSQSEVRWVKGVEKDNPDREYLTVDAFMWTTYFPEARKVLEGKNNQSMEIEILDGDFREDGFFEITDARFLSLCILGEDVEPCFEGASISKFNLGNTFNKHQQEVIADGGGVEDKMEKEKFEETENIENETVEEVESNETEELELEEENVETKEGDSEDTETNEADDKIKELTEALEKLENQIENIGKEKDVLENSLNEKNVEFESLKKENEELAEFKKATKLKEKTNQVDNVLKEFNIDNLISSEVYTKESIEELRQNAINNMEIIDLKKELSYQIMQNQILESKTKENVQNSFAINTSIKEDIVVENPYGKLSEYIK